MAVKRRSFIRARKAAGYTQEGLAERLGVDRTTVARWESGEYSPQPWLRPRIAKAFGVSLCALGELLDGGGSPKHHVVEVSASLIKSEGELLAVPDPVGVLDPDERERLSLAAVQPCRTDGAALEALAAVLFAIRRLEDETSAAAVLPIVQQQRTLADRLAAGVPAHARPAAVGLSSEINQYLGWLSIPLGRWDDAHRYLDHAAVAALEADDPLRLSTALSFHAYTWLRTGDLRKADSLSEAAQRDTRVHRGLRTYLTYQRAEVLARDNNRTDAVRLLTKADRMVEQLPPPQELPPSGYWYVPAFFLGQRSFVLHALGDTNGARRSMLECLATMPGTWRDSEWAIRRRKLVEE